MRRLETLALVLAMSVTSSSVLALTGSPEDAESLFRDGRARMEAGDVVRACPQFAASLRLDRAPGTLLNLAACEEQLGQLASAWQHFVELSALLPADDDRRAFVLDRIAKLEPRVPRISVAMAGAPAGTIVTSDYAELGATTLGQSLPANPGEHRVIVITPGHADARYDVTLREGERRSLVVAPGELTAAEIARRSGAGTKRTVGWTLGAAGTVALVTGAYFGARALSEGARSDARCGATTCRDAAALQSYDDARTFARVADVTLGAGFLAVGIAAYLLLSSQGESRELPTPTRTSIRITPFGIGGAW